MDCVFFPSSWTTTHDFHILFPISFFLPSFISLFYFYVLQISCALLNRYHSFMFSLFKNMALVVVPSSYIVHSPHKRIYGPNNIQTILLFSGLYLGWTWELFNISLEPWLWSKNSIIRLLDILSANLFPDAVAGIAC